MIIMRSFRMLCFNNNIVSRTIRILQFNTHLHFLDINIQESKCMRIMMVVLNNVTEMGKTCHVQDNGSGKCGFGIGKTINTILEIK